MLQHSDKAEITKKLREIKGKLYANSLTQKQLAERAKINHNTLRAYFHQALHGNVSNFDLEKANFLSNLVDEMVVENSPTLEK